MKQTEEARRAEYAKAQEDAFIFGTGVVRKHRNGWVEYVPIFEVEILTHQTKEKSK